METTKRLAACIGKKTADLIVLPWPLWMGFPQSAHAHPLLVAMSGTSPGPKASAHYTGSSLSVVSLLIPPRPASQGSLSCTQGRGGQREEGSIDVFTPLPTPVSFPGLSSDGRTCG